MDFNLYRTDSLSDGIWGELTSIDHSLNIFTLEHAFPNDDVFRPIIPAGKYQCQRGQHLLEHLGSIQTFEVMNVPGHSGILFHPGNFNADSNGCILLGLGIDRCNDGSHMLMESRKAFGEFMTAQDGLDEFWLNVFDVIDDDDIAA